VLDEFLDGLLTTHGLSWRTHLNTVFFNNFGGWS
jgi:hypothetical protein